MLPRTPLSAMMMDKDVRLRLVLPGESPADDAALVDAARRGSQEASRQIYERYAPHIERTLSRLLGATAELPDALQDVFAVAFRRLGEVHHAEGLRPWLVQIAVLTARGRLRARRRAWWLMFLGFDESAAPPAETSAEHEEAVEALRATYSVLDRMPVDDRIVFSMRYLEGMELQEVAKGCGVSLATVKRRLGRAETRFLAAAQRMPALTPWVKGAAL